jgi:hypothetical protein
VARYDDVEARVNELITRLSTEFADLGGELRWSVTRALIHRAVHYATEKPGVEYCALATYLGDMIGHAHKLAHGENPQASSHKDIVH